MKLTRNAGLRALGIAVAVILSSLGLGRAGAQEPDWQFADVLAPHYDNAPTQDILDLKLGMTVDAVRLTLANNGFTVQGNSLGRTARGAGNMRYLEATRPHENTRPTYERIVVYFDFSENPRVLAVYRNSQYRSGQRPAYSTVMSALLDKYGDAPVYDTRSNEVMGSWHPERLSRKCKPMRSNFRYFQAPSDVEGYEGCYRGLAVKVGFQNNVAGRPVEYTRSFLFDARILDANYKETFRLARELAEQRERERRGELADRAAAEF